MTFRDLAFKVFSDDVGGIQAEHTFPNGYGVSVVRHSFSYGGKQGKYELAVTDTGGLCYSTPITDDVLGWLSEDAVSEALIAVESLPQHA